jgi:hypothetical protein
MYADVRGLESLADLRNSSVWGELSSTGSLTHLSGERLKCVGSFAHTVGDHLTRNVSKLMHTLLTDAEAVFLGFGNACASAGRTGCKLLTLLHKGATGEDVKRLIEDSHDVGEQSGGGLPFLDLNTIHS